MPGQCTRWDEMAGRHQRSRICTLPPPPFHAKGSERGPVLPFSGNPVPEECLSIITGKPGPDTPVMIAAVTGVPSLVIRIRRRKRSKPVRCQERPGNCAKRSYGMFRTDKTKSDRNHLIWPD